MLLSEIKHSWRGKQEEERPLLARLALHSYCVSFFHPVSAQELCITAPYPRDLDALRKQLAKLFGEDPLCETKEDTAIGSPRSQVFRQRTRTT